MQNTIVAPMPSFEILSRAWLNYLMGRITYGQYIAITLEITRPANN